jgi:hypothetical protein
MLVVSERLQDWLAELIRTAVNILLYLCSEKPDTIVVKDPAKRRRHAKGGKPSQSPRMIKVGWRLGPAFHTARRASADQPPATTGTRKRPVPHQRRGYFQTYWTGPGRTTPILRFIRPSWVNVDLAAGGRSAQHTVITVGPRPSQ